MKNITHLGLGLAALGRPDYINIRGAACIDKSPSAFRANAFKVLDEAYAMGIRFFDTAPSYGKGESFLLDWYLSRKHTDLQLSTKWGYTYMANWEVGYTGKHEVKEHSLSKLQEQWSRSKALLPALKVYQVHSATLESGILSNNPVLEALHRLKSTHSIKLGITSTGINQVEVLTLASQIQVNNEFLFDSFQVTFNLFEQSTYDILVKLRKAGRSILVKEALANGRVFPNEQFKKYSQYYKILTDLAAKYSVGVDAIALRFVIDYVQPTVVLSGASNHQQLVENNQASDFTLTPAEITMLTSFQQNSDEYWHERTNLSWN